MYSSCLGKTTKFNVAIGRIKKIFKLALTDVIMNYSGGGIIFVVV